MVGNSIKTRGLHTGIRFAPAVVMDKEQKRRFQMRASQGFDWARHEYNDKAWRLSSPQSEGDPRSHLKLTIQPEQINFEDFFPVGPFDLYIDNLKLALEIVEDVFAPKILLGSGAMIRLTAEADGNDARIFLGNRCLGLDRRLAPLGRPVHAVGLKMLLPPVAVKDQPPWQAEIKIESLVEDIRQIFIEADANWSMPMAWNTEEVVRRVTIASEFTRNEVVNFLQQYEQSDGNG